MRSFDEKVFLAEVSFKTSRSSGKGGQHVNKTESRVSLFFDIEESDLLTGEEKSILKERLMSRLTDGKIIQIDVEDSRSQQRNKEIALKRLIKLLGDNSKPKKKRKISKPSKAAIKKRLKAKKVQSEKKQFRRKDNLL
ncbi:MAG: aminoacyl-tRNA hydrolase [Flavobacteriales bacterium]|nr:aminoacyl-tRNA hydrolase [Flavobacteriales bacterium]|tara:strand:- start:99382 stop:99795 length:414 start_codon:yes stop_codon:yes gene_type:complete